MRLYATILLVVFHVAMVFGESQDIPYEGIQVRLVADSVKSTTDFFLATMPNTSNTRYAVNQIKIEYRPLYIKDFVEHKPAVSLSDMRGFAFGALRPTTETAVYVGYYYEEQGSQPEFRIETFSPEDVLAKTAKNGFVLGIYDGMLAFHGQPGYTAAFSEFIMYGRKLTEGQDKQIRSYLKARYNLRNDSRHLRNNPTIIHSNLLNISNVVNGKEKTLICGAAIVNTEKRGKKKSVDLVRSYNSGGKWSRTIGRILEHEQTSEDVESFMYVSSTGVIYFFYCKSATDGGYKLVCKYSIDEGYNWSEDKFIDQTYSSLKMNITTSFMLKKSVAFAVKRKGGSTILLLSEEIAYTNDPKDIKWDVCSKVGQAISIDGAVADNVALASYSDNLYCFFNTDDGFILQTSSIDNGQNWSEPHKVIVDGFELRNPAQADLFSYTDTSGIILCFRNRPQISPSQSDTVWTTRADFKNGQLEWNCPQIAFYSREFNEDATIDINSITRTDETLNSSITCGQAAYFCLFNDVTISDIVPQGAGVFELKDNYDKQESYSIPPLPSLLTNSFLIEMDATEYMLEDDQLIFKIGDEERKLVFFTENRRFGLFITDGKNSAVLKTTRFTESTKRRLIIEFDGKADIMRVLVDDSMTGWDINDSKGWAYFSAEIEQLTDSEELFIPFGVHKCISKLSVHYKTEDNY